MIRIGVCDDCIEQVDLVTKYIHKYMKLDDLDLFSSIDPTLFLTYSKESLPEIVFLDIDMDGMNGIALGEAIRAINEDTVIVYITGYKDYALDAFDVRAYHYLLKPVSESRFVATLEDAIHTVDLIRMKKIKKGKFIYKSKGEVASIDYDHICYFEKTGRKIKIQTETDFIEFYGKFVDLIEQLDQNLFVQCHQGFIINKEKIVSYKNHILSMTKYESVPVSRTYQKEIKKMIERLLFDEDII